MAYVRPALVAVLFAALVGCVSKSTPAQVKEPPNIRAYATTPEKIWPVLLDVLEKDLALQLEVKDTKGGIFASAYVRQAFGEQVTRYRLSGNLLFDGQRVFVTVYRQMESFEDRKWKGIPTDFTLERRALDQLQKRITP